MLPAVLNLSDVLHHAVTFIHLSNYSTHNLLGPCISWSAHKTRWLGRIKWGWASYHLFICNAWWRFEQLNQLEFRIWSRIITNVRNRCLWAFLDADSVEDSSWKWTTGVACRGFQIRKELVFVFSEINFIGSLILFTTLVTSWIEWSHDDTWITFGESHKTKTKCGNNKDHEYDATDDICARSIPLQSLIIFGQLIFF